MMQDNLMQEKRRMVELSVEAGRKRQRKQTGLIHFCYESETGDHDTIPLFENACFALALFRTRLSENVLEGKAVIEKILAFRGGGNFPVYLHEFPICKNRNLSFQLLPVFFYIQKEFANILGEILSQKLQEAIFDILSYGQKLSEQKLLPKGAEAKCSAACQNTEFLSWQPSSSAEWADFLIAYQMCNFCTPLEKAPLEQACLFWDANVHAYVGKEKHLVQEKEEPIPTLYELFMGALFHRFSQRLLRDHLLHIQASLIYPFDYDVTAMQGKRSFVTSPKGEDPHRILWGDQSCLHSLVWEGKNCRIEKVVVDDGIDLHFILPTVIPEEDDRMEISLYFNLHEKNSISLEGGKATIFPLEETLYISSFPICWKVDFTEVEGCGKYVGHLSRGNRSGQIATKGEKRFEAFDHRVSLRTLQRDAGAKIKISLRMSLNAETAPI